LHSAFFNDETKFSPESRSWLKLGFSDKTLKEDLRSTGIFGLIQIIFAVILF